MWQICAAWTKADSGMCEQGALLDQFLCSGQPLFVAAVIEQKMLCSHHCEAKLCGTIAARPNSVQPLLLD